MAPKEKASKGKTDNLKQEDVLQAVVLADAFNNKFGPLINDKPKALLPLVNTPLIEYTLDFLSSAGIQEVFLYCCSHVDKIKAYISDSRWGSESCHMMVKVLYSEDATSPGDALRDLDAKALLRGDFFLLSGDVVANVELQPILEEFRKKKAEDKGTVMSVVYRQASPAHAARCLEDETVVALESQSNRILQHYKVHSVKKLNFPLVPALFSDNFDFQSRDDFIRGILENEDILGSTLYVHILNDGYAAPAVNLSMYNALSRDVMRRWTFPLIPERSKGQQRYVTSRRNQYKHKTVTIGQGTTLGSDVVIGCESSVGKDCKIRNSVIGDNCCIGNNVSISNSYLWDSVTVMDGCSIDTCIVGDDTKLEEGCSLSRGCVIGSGAHFSKNVSISGGQRVVGSSSEFKGKKLCEGAYVYTEAADSDSESDEELDTVDMWGMEEEEANDSMSDVTSSDDEQEQDVSPSASPPPDDLKLFYNEVLDSFSRGLEEKVKCENLILEVNSSKYAYNVTMKELNGFIMKATLNQPTLKSCTSTVDYLGRLKQIIEHLTPLYSNYYKSIDSQQDCLTALEEVCDSCSHLPLVLMKVLHQLYDSDVLTEEAIVAWYKSTDNVELRAKVAAFVKWLEEADEESEEESD